jgi:DNA-binding LacI/PurR family transcriptional regulator
VRGSCAVFKEWWARRDRPGALFFYDDSLCDIAASAILEMGINVPKELAIISHANVGRRFSFPIPITSIGFDPVETISSGWELLDKLINRERIENTAVYVKPHVSLGKSV